MSKRSVYKKRKHKPNKPGLTPEDIKFLKQENQERLACLKRMKAQRKNLIKARIKIKKKVLRRQGQGKVPAS